MTRVRFGPGTPIPSKDRFGPCTLVEAGNQKLLIDAGRGAAPLRHRVTSIRRSQHLRPAVPASPPEAASQLCRLSSAQDRLDDFWCSHAPSTTDTWGNAGFSGLTEFSVLPTYYTRRSHA